MIKYSEARAAEDTAFGQGLVPVCVGCLLLPVWRAEVSATIRYSEPYDLVDRYVEAGIARGGLGTERELADFFGLDVAVAGGAVRFLESIGHLSRGADGRVALSGLGRDSVARGRRCYELRDRRRLYFDAFTFRPLSWRYYDEGNSPFTDGTGGGDFTPVVPRQPFLDPGALAVLTSMRGPDRDRFNLPEEVLSPSLTGEAEMVYLPAYVMRAAGRDGSARYLVYTQASRQEADAEWTQACSGTAVPALVDSLNQEDSAQLEDRARRYLDSFVAGQYELGWRDKVLTATLRPDAFSAGGSPQPNQLGSFVALRGGCFLRLWCDDGRLRERAMLDRAASYLGDRPRIGDREEAIRRLERYCRQSGLGPLSPGEVAVIAEKSGRSRLAARIRPLAQ